MTTEVRRVIRKAYFVAIKETYFSKTVISSISDYHLEDDDGFWIENERVDLD